MLKFKIFLPFALLFSFAIFSGCYTQLAPPVTQEYKTQIVDPEDSTDTEIVEEEYIDDYAPTHVYIYGGRPVRYHVYDPYWDSWYWPYYGGSRFYYSYSYWDPFWDPFAWCGTWYYDDYWYSRQSRPWGYVGVNYWYNPYYRDPYYYGGRYVNVHYNKPRHFDRRGRTRRSSQYAGTSISRDGQTLDKPSRRGTPRSRRTDTGSISRHGDPVGAGGNLVSGRRTRKGSTTTVGRRTGSDANSGKTTVTRRTRRSGSSISGTRKSGGSTPAKVTKRTRRSGSSSGSKTVTRRKSSSSGSSGTKVKRSRSKSSGSSSSGRSYKPASRSSGSSKSYSRSRSSSSSGSSKSFGSRSRSSSGSSSKRSRK